MRKKHLILWSIFIIFSTLIFSGCTKESVTKKAEESAAAIEYEVITFKEAPKKVQDYINLMEEQYQEIRNSPEFEERKGLNRYNGSINVEKDRYEYFTSDELKPVVLEIQHDQGFGIGIMVKCTYEPVEAKGFPDNVTIIHFKGYRGPISYAFVNN